jgi:hypothetical protein
MIFLRTTDGGLANLSQVTFVRQAEKDKVAVEQARQYGCIF